VVGVSFMICSSSKTTHDTPKANAAGGGCQRNRNERVTLYFIHGRNTPFLRPWRASTPALPLHRWAHALAGGALACGSSCVCWQPLFSFPLGGQGVSLRLLPVPLFPPSGRQGRDGCGCPPSSTTSLGRHLATPGAHHRPALRECSANISRTSSAPEHPRLAPASAPPALPACALGPGRWHRGGTPPSRPLPPRRGGEKMGVVMPIYLKCTDSRRAGFLPRPAT
jgi:hypothetical protein